MDFSIEQIERMSSEEIYTLLAENNKPKKRDWSIWIQESWLSIIKILGTSLTISLLLYTVMVWACDMSTNFENNIETQSFWYGMYIFGQVTWMLIEIGGFILIFFYTLYCLEEHLSRQEELSYKE